MKKNENYNEWKRFYIQDYKVDISRKIVSEVINGEYVTLTFGEVLDLGNRYCDLAIFIRRACMKAAYTGKDPREALRNLVIYNISRCKTYIKPLTA